MCEDDDDDDDDAISYTPARVKESVVGLISVNKVPTNVYATKSNLFGPDDQKRPKKKSST